MNIQLPHIQPLIREPKSFDVLIENSRIYYTDGEVIYVMIHEAPIIIGSFYTTWGAYNLIRLYKNFYHDKSGRIRIKLDYGGSYINLEESKSAPRLPFLEFTQSLREGITEITETTRIRPMPLSIALRNATAVFGMGRTVKQFKHEEKGIIIMSYPDCMLIGTEDGANHSIFEQLTALQSAHAA